MSTVKQILVKLFSPLDAQQQAEQAYLAQAVDVCDLERRIHDIEYRDVAILDFPAQAGHTGTPLWRSPW
ncbi:MAG: DUF3563 family protein [Thiomonas sp.]